MDMLAQKHLPRMDMLARISSLIGTSTSVKEKATPADSVKRIRKHTHTTQPQYNAMTSRIQFTLKLNNSRSFHHIWFKIIFALNTWWFCFWVATDNVIDDVHNETLKIVLTQPITIFATGCQILHMHRAWWHFLHTVANSSACCKLFAPLLTRLCRLFSPLLTRLCRLLAPLLTRLCRLYVCYLICGSFFAPLLTTLLHNLCSVLPTDTRLAYRPIFILYSCIHSNQ